MIVTNYKIIYIDLPTTVKGFCVYTNDDYYTIVLNSKLSYDDNIDTYFHELEHITERDFEKQLTADQIEKEIHVGR